MKALITQFDNNQLEKTVATPTCSCCCCCCCCLATTIVSSYAISQEVDREAMHDEISSGKRRAITTTAFIIAMICISTILGLSLYMLLVQGIDPLMIIVIAALFYIVTRPLTWRKQKIHVATTRVVIMTGIEILIALTMMMIFGPIIMGILPNGGMLHVVIIMDLILVAIVVPRYINHVKARRRHEAVVQEEINNLVRNNPPNQR